MKHAAPLHPGAQLAARGGHSSHLAGKRPSAQGDTASCLSRKAWTRGRWVYNPSMRPPYVEQDANAAKGNPQSLKMRRSPMCAPHLQQSWRWEWDSNSAECAFEHPNHTRFCARLRGRRILLYGDSLTQQLFVSLASLASNSSTASRPDECVRVKPLECIRLCDGSCLLCHRLRFGLALDYLGHHLASLEECSVNPSSVAHLNETFSPPCIQSFDLVLLQEFAHWVGSDGAIKVEECLRKRGLPDATQRAQSHILKLYRGQMHRNAAFLRNATRSWKARVFFRTAIPGYPPADVLVPDTLHSAPPLFVAPRPNTTWAYEFSRREVSQWNHHLWERMNAIAKHAYHENGLHVLDTEIAMLQRVDGHLDPLHYCLPGPPDFTSQVLFNFLL
ncbi:hypothetical protein AB1Y20_000976 [Prymnesium parvum]|uniref:Trichome birefringence-like C-terminal domain-containing protein n=1 Tax=Prymnesium parvum TaxID=97485 RepID=A0AB34K6E4_PRYPA